MENPADFGFVRVAAAVPVCTPTRPDVNANRIAALAEKAADDGARVVVFPELAISGYTCGDLFLQKRLEEDVRKAAQDLAGALPRSVVAVVGAPWRFRGMLFNAALVFSGGRLAGIVPKTFLPNYKEFYEKRWFVSGAATDGGDCVVGREPVPFGRDLLFRAGWERELLFGVEICEDLWVPTPPSSAQALAGAQLLMNLSASDETIGKSDYRRTHLVAAQSARCLAGLIYVSCGPGESSSDLVFGGHTLIAENGAILAEDRRFQEGPTLTVADVDLDRLTADRDRTGSFADAAAASAARFRTVTVSEKAAAARKFTRRIEPAPFVPADPATLDARCEEVVQIQTGGLQRRLRHLAKLRPVIGLSGGLDSALAGLVCARTLMKMEVAPRALLAVSMPGPGTSARTRENARKLAGSLGAELREISIDAALAQHLKDIAHSGAPDRTFENAQSRERTQILMDLANAEGGVVIGTADLSEIALGWSTYGGDHISMYDVNASVPKTLVRQVVAWFARGGPPALAAVLEDILGTPVSPELLPMRDGAIHQKTEEILGPFELHDFFLYHFLRGGDPPRKLLFLAARAFDGVYPEDVRVKTLRTFLTRFFANQYKRNAMPDGPKVGTVALSPRGDWRMPADVSAETWLADLPED
ncbi:MAG TPA: NAD(+) synthase [Thermoanaerobaculia bacterium]|jgi:NAD+ synthase (glutamine-hydrolysing)|nr:NAD(+) synthase [Thermoanaerobaculia bacterium]